MATISDGEFWPKIAAVFEMAVAEPQTICLTQHMADKGALWEEITAKYKLKRVSYTDLVAWPFRHRRCYRRNPSPHVGQAGGHFVICGAAHLRWR